MDYDPRHKSKTQAHKDKMSAKYKALKEIRNRYNSSMKHRNYIGQKKKKEPV